MSGHNGRNRKNDGGARHGNGSGPATTDRELVRSFQEGSEGAYEEIYRRYSPRVRWLCSRMLGNQQDAEEASQETFLKAYVGLERFNGRYQLKAWLSRIAVNVCLDEVRSRSRNGNVITLPPEAEIGGHESSPEEVVAGERLRLDSALDGIQPLHARAIVLRGYGLSHKEIADRLDMTPAQVKALLHRARRSFSRAWRRVEGWSLAPLGAFRSLLPRRTDAAGAGAAHAPHFAMVTNSLGAGLAERVAAAGVVVAVALTGSSITVLPADAGASSAAADGRERSVVAADDASEPSGPRNGSQAAASSEGTTQPTLAADVGAVVAKIKHAVRPERERPQQEEEEEDQDSGLGGTSASGAKKTGKRTKNEIRRTAESLPRPLP